MPDLDAVIHAGGIDLRASLSLPETGPARGGLAALHGAAMPSADWFLHRHLAQALPGHGFGVVRFDRRPSAGDLPFDVQAGDALAALALLRSQPGMQAAPLGLWGFSQGAWAAAVAASQAPEVAFLILAGAAGMSPGEQMRYGCERQLRAKGYSGQDLEELRRLRTAFERFQRGQLPRGQAQAAVDRAAERPWFPLVYIPRRLGEPGSWRDMDFDPRPYFAAVRCPVLLFYGEDDEWVPIDGSIRAWREAAGTRDLSVVRLPGTMHTPVLGGEETVEAVSPRYTEALIGWLLDRFA